MTHNSPANTQSVPVKADTAAVFCVIAAIAVLSIFAPEKRPFFVRSPSAQVNTAKPSGGTEKTVRFCRADERGNFACQQTFCFKCEHAPHFPNE